MNNLSGSFLLEEPSHQGKCKLQSYWQQFLLDQVIYIILKIISPQFQQAGVGEFSKLDLISGFNNQIFTETIFFNNSV